MEDRYGTRVEAPIALAEQGSTFSNEYIEF
jgi:hypothetical protein